MDFHQFTRTVQKIVLYETKSVSFQSKIQIILDEFDHWIFQRLYIVGSNHAQTKFRIIKVDRTEPRDLLISDDKVIYDPIQIREVLNMIDVGKSIEKTHAGKATKRLRLIENSTQRTQRHLYHFCEPQINLKFNFLRIFAFSRQISSN